MSTEHRQQIDAVATVGQTDEQPLQIVLDELPDGFDRAAALDSIRIEFGDVDDVAGGRQSGVAE